MKKYDKLFIPEKKEGVFAFRDNQGDVPVSIHGQFIITTIEELREMWDTALGWGPEVKDWDDKSHTFAEYLTLKGINIIP